MQICLGTWGVVQDPGKLCKTEIRGPWREESEGTGICTLVFALTRNCPRSTYVCVICSEEKAKGGKWWGEKGLRRKLDEGLDKFIPADLIVKRAHKHPKVTCTGLLRTALSEKTHAHRQARSLWAHARLPGAPACQPPGCRRREHRPEGKWLSKSFAKYSTETDLKFLSDHTYSGASGKYTQEKNYKRKFPLSSFFFLSQECSTSDLYINISLTFIIATFLEREREKGTEGEGETGR